MGASWRQETCLEAVWIIGGHPDSFAFVVAQFSRIQRPYPHYHLYRGSLKQVLNAKSCSSQCEAW